MISGSKRIDEAIEIKKTGLAGLAGAYAVGAGLAGAYAGGAGLAGLAGAYAVGRTLILPPRCMANTGSSVPVDGLDSNMGYPLCVKDTVREVSGSR